MKLHIIRHAETEYNKLGIIQGSEVDSELNDIGLRQSQLFYDYYKDHNFQKIYSIMSKNLNITKIFHLRYL